MLHKKTRISARAFWSTLLSIVGAQLIMLFLGDQPLISAPLLLILWGLMLGVANGQPRYPQWRHIKTQGIYSELCTGKIQTSRPLVDYDIVTVYRGENGLIWVRPIAEFRIKFESIGE